MSGDTQQRQIRVGETADGAPLKLPVIEVLTGRGFATGKSGSGKSNTASVIAEELLEAGYPLLIVDTDGEYYGLKEEYEMLHAGADEECDIQIGPEHAEQMATIALEENVPVILDVSGYLDSDVADELLREVARQLFVKEKKLKKPFLLVVEEVHEYIPEGGGVGETGNLLIKISKRGRKHGLGILGISQRPADVKKDFITQANWLVWHRLTWDNDTKVVGRIIDTEYSDLVSELDDGQAFVQTDWTETDVRKVQFRRKRTFDAGATPGLEDVERPELKSVSDALVGDLQQISERKDREQDRIQELENELAKKEKRIETLEDELSSARDVSSAARQMADALQNTETIQSELPDSGEDLRRLHEEIADLEDERDQLRDRLDERDERVAALETELADRIDELERLRGENEQLRTVVRERAAAKREADPNDDADGSRSGEAGTESADGDGTEIVQAGGDAVEFGYMSDDDADGDSSGATESASSGSDEGVVVADEDRRIGEILETDLEDRLARACEGSQCSVETAESIVELFAGAGPLRTGTVAARVDRSRVAVQSLVSELRTEGVLERAGDRTYALHEDVRSELRTAATGE